MNPSKRVMKFQGYSMKKAMIGFWVVVLLINILVSTIAIYTEGTNIQFGPSINDGGMLSIAASNIMPIFIFFIVYGILTYYDDFAIALSFGVTRKDYYKSVITNHLITASSFAIIQSVLMIIEKSSARFLGYNLMVEFGLFNTKNDNILFIVFALFIFFLTLVSMANLVGVLQYRYNYKFWIGFGIFFILITTISTRLSIDTSQLYESAVAMFGNGLTFILGIIITIVFYTVGYIFFKRASISK